MIEQYLTNKNESAIMLKSKKILDLNKVLVKVTSSIVWHGVHGTTILKNNKKYLYNLYC